jgi:site-specific DNA-adenine methylase
MFSYYGSKGKVVKCYPPPKEKKIIEPFAGSARYSLKYWQNDILLVDKYKVIIEIWDYLINATEKDILGLPKMKTGECIDNFNLSEIERKFMGFIVQTSSGMRKTVSPFVEDTSKPLKQIADQLFKIRHWKTKHGSYLDLDNEIATWFIDPPYQFGGHEYKESNKNIDFNKLGEWCKTRKGQVIVCENTKADWLPFKPMVAMHGAMFKTTEAIWSNFKTNYEYQQSKLF